MGETLGLSRSPLALDDIYILRYNDSIVILRLFDATDIMMI